MQAGLPRESGHDFVSSIIAPGNLCRAARMFPEDDMAVCLLSG